VPMASIIEMTFIACLFVIYKASLAVEPKTS